MKSKFSVAREKYIIIRSWSETNEYLLFGLLLLFNLLPALSGKYFVTLDGPAHLHNAQLFLDMIVNPESALHEYYALNELVPNLNSTVILAFFLSFLPAFLAEKVFVILYLILTPLSFRYLIGSFSTSNKLFSYFIFPFTFTFVFLLGFYNFSIAIVILFFTLGFWIRYRAKAFSLKNFLFLLSLLLFTYFSHIFILAFVLLFMGLELLIGTAGSLYRNRNQVKEILQKFFMQTATLLAAAAIPLFFTYRFMSSRTTAEDLLMYLDSEELVSIITQFRPLIAYNFEIESPFTTALSYLLLFLFAAALILYFIRAIKKTGDLPTNPVKFKFLEPSIFWFSTFLILCVAYAIMPNQVGIGGYISVRLAFLLLITFILWLSTLRMPQWLMIGVILVIIYINGNLTLYYLTVQRSLNNIAISIEEASELVEPYSTLIPLDFSGNWLFPHISNYAGINKPVVVLENYEASSGSFPILWKSNTFPQILLGTKNNSEFECAYWHTSSSSNKESADYVLVIGQLENTEQLCQKSIAEELQASFEIIYQSSHCTLHKLSVQQQTMTGEMAP